MVPDLTGKTPDSEFLKLEFTLAQVSCHCSPSTQYCCCTVHQRLVPVLCPPPGSQQMVGVTPLSEITAGSCNMCCGPIGCLHSHGPPAPVDYQPARPPARPLHQLPRQPQSPHVCLSVNTNYILHFYLRNCSSLIHS